MTKVILAEGKDSFRNKASIKIDTLEGHRVDTAAEFVRWLQQSVTVGLRRAQMSAHPADEARRRLLASFAAADASAFFAAESPSVVPWIIGVKLLNADTGAPTKVHVVRSLPGNPRAQYFQAEAVVKRLYVGYPQGAAGPDRSRPLVLAINQIDPVSRSVGGKWKLVDVPADSPRRAIGCRGDCRCVYVGTRLRHQKNQWRTIPTAEF